MKTHKVTAAVVILALIVAAAPTYAQGPVEQLGRQIVAAQAQQGGFATPPDGNKMLLPAIALLGGGATLSILGVTALKSKGDDYDVCYFFLEDDNICSDEKETNKGLLWGGIAMAGAGATLAAVGAANSSIQMRPGGFALKHRVKF